MDDVVFVIDQDAFHREFRSWQGIVGRDMIRRLTKGVALAKKSAPGPTTRPRNRTGINYSTGALEKQILPGRARWGYELEGRVIALPKYALYVHEGTKPHRIPSIGNIRAKTLRFYWHRVGGIVYFKHVQHPGTRRTPFLSENLRAMVK